MVHLIVQVIICFLECIGILVEVLTDATDHFELKLFLLEFNELACVLDFLVEIPCLVEEDMRVETKLVLLASTEREKFVELFIIDDFVLEEAVAQLNDCLLWPANLC